MAILYLELYQGDIPASLSSLNGAENYHPRDNIYWAVLTTEPEPGSDAANYIQAVELDNFPNTFTHGTDTLPLGNQNFVLSSLCIWQPKLPPYAFRVTLPDASELILSPPGELSVTEHDWFCETLASDNFSIGIFVIEVVLNGASQLPTDVDNSNAMLNLAQLPFSEDFFEKQPLLKVNGFVQNLSPQCPEIVDVVVNGCAPGNVEFLVTFDQFEGINQIIWTLGDGNSVTITLAHENNVVSVASVEPIEPSTITTDQIELVQSSLLFTLKLTYDYAVQVNLPPDYLHAMVFVIRTSCGNPSFTAPILVPICEGTTLPACPNINGPEVIIDEFCVDGKVNVDINSQIASDYYGGNLRLVSIGADNIESSAGDLSQQQVQITPDGALNLSASIELAPASYKVYCENSCSSSTALFEIECNACPEITFLLISSGVDCINGLRPMTFSAEVKAKSKGGILHVQFVDITSGDIISSASSANGIIVFSGTRHYPEGSHDIRVDVLEPEGCEYSDGSNVLSIQAAPCNSPDCPNIDISNIDIDVAPGCENNQRNVRFQSNITLPESFNGTVDAQISDLTDELEDISSTSASFNFDVNKSYPPGTFTVAINVDTDDGCNYGRSESFTVPPCVPPPWRPPSWVPPVPDWLCMLWLIFNFLLLLITGIAIAVAACAWSVAPVFYTALIIGLIAGVLAIISWILWILLCGWKPNVCPFARWLPRILGIIAFVAAGIVLVVAIVEAVAFAILSAEAGGAGALASLPCFLGAAIEFAYFAFVGWLLWEFLLIVGCPPLPLISLPPLEDS